jgi:hypothetical protein
MTVLDNTSNCCVNKGDMKELHLEVPEQLTNEGKRNGQLQEFRRK